MVFSKVLLYLSRLKNYVSFSQIIFNDNKFFYLSNSTLSPSFTAITADDSPLDLQITTTEASTLPIPSQLTSTTINNFIQRWNNTFYNWKQGSLQSTNNSFIDYISMYNSFTIVLNDHQTALHDGYLDIIHGYSSSFASLQSKMVLKDTCFEVQLEASAHQLIAGDTFFLTLTMTNPTNDSISNIDIPITFMDSELNAANDRFLVSTPTIKGVSGDIHGSGTLSGTAIIQWTITALSNIYSSQKETFTVGGTTTYMQKSRPISVTLFEDIVVSYPPPLLTLHYFIPSSFPGYFRGIYSLY